MSRRTPGILLAILLLTGMAVGTLLVLEPAFSLDPVRDRLAASLSARLGREISLSGPVTLQLGRRVHLDLHDVRIANPGWAGPAALIRAGHLAASLDLPGLLSGILDVDAVVLEDVSVALVVSASGQPGWQMQSSGTRTGADDRASGAWRVIVENMSLQHVTLVYRQLASGQELVWSTDHMQQRNVSGMLELEGGGLLNGAPWRLAGKAGPLLSLRSGHAIQVALQAVLQATEITLDGRLDDLAQLDGLTLVAAIHGPDFAALLRVLGIEYAEPGDIDLDITVSDREHGFAWESAGHLGALHVDTRGELGNPRQFHDLRMSLIADGQDLSLLGRVLGVAALPVQAWRIHGEVLYAGQRLELRDCRAESGGARLQLAAQMPHFPTLDAARVKLDAALPEPARYAGLSDRMRGLPGPLQINAVLSPNQDGTEQLVSELRLDRHRLELAGTLGKHPEYRHTQLAFDVTGPDLVALLGNPAHGSLPAEPYHLSGSLAVQPDRTLTLQLDNGAVGNARIGAHGSLGRIPGFTDADLAITLQGESLHQAFAALSGRALPAQPFDMKTRLRGRLPEAVLDGAAVRLGEARLELTGRLGLPPRYAGTDAQLVLQVPDPGKLLPVPDSAGWARGSYQLTGRIAGSDEALKLRDIKVSGHACSCW